MARRTRGINHPNIIMSVHRTAAANATTAPPNSIPASPVIWGIPPVLTAEELELEPEEEVEDFEAVWDAEVVLLLPDSAVVVAEAVAATLVTDPAVIVTGKKDISLCWIVEITVPGKLASGPSAIAVQAAEVVPATEQLTV